MLERVSIRVLLPLTLCVAAASCSLLPPNWLDEAFSNSAHSGGFVSWYASTTADFDGDGLRDFVIHRRIDEVRFDLIVVSGSMTRPIERLEFSGRFDFGAVPDVDGDHGAELLLIEPGPEGTTARALVVSGTRARILFDTTNPEEIRVLEGARIAESLHREPLRWAWFDLVRGPRWNLIGEDRAPAAFALLSPTEIPLTVVEWPGIEVLHAIGDFDGDYTLDWAARRRATSELLIVSPEKGTVLATWNSSPDLTVSGVVEAIDDRDSDGQPDLLLSVSAFAGPDAITHASYFGLATVISSRSGRPLATFERAAFLARLPADLPTVSILRSTAPKGSWLEMGVEREVVPSTPRNP